MKRITRLSILVAVTAAGVCLTLAFSNEAVAQITITVPGANRSHYNGYSSYYNRGYEGGYVQHGYTGYGGGPYGYGSTTYGYRSTAPFGYRPSAEYGYRGSTSRSLYDRRLRLHGGTGSYRSIYIPPTTRYYSPYGYGGGYRGY